MIALDLIIVYFTLTLWEWVLHAKVMHGDPDQLRRVPIVGPTLAKVAADHLAHHIDVQIDMTLKGDAHESGLFFSWQTTIVGTLLVFATLKTARMGTTQALSLSITASLLMSVLWNSWHASMHGTDLTVDAKKGMPRWKGLSRGPLYRWLWKYHAIHHSQKGQKYNFNIIFPGFDWLMGTYKSHCFDNTAYCEENQQDGRCNQTKRHCYTDVDVLPKMSME